MKPFLHIGRRKFLRDSALSLGAAPLIARAAVPATTSESSAPGAMSSSSDGVKMLAKFGSTTSVWIISEPHAGFQEQWASRELARGLRNLGLAREPVQAAMGESELPSSSLAFFLSVNRQHFKHPEAYEISYAAAAGKPPQVGLIGATPQAVLYSVFDFLERQGAFFGLDGEVYPLEPAHALNFPSPGEPWQSQPRFSVRGLVPWPDFLNCVTIYNREDWRAYLEAMVRMRFNTLGVHVYDAESFLSFEYAGAGHLAFADTTATNRAGYLPERTSRYGMGAADFFADEVFGSEATTQARSCWEAEEFAQRLWGEAFKYANSSEYVPAWALSPTKFRMRFIVQLPQRHTSRHPIRKFPFRASIRSRSPHAISWRRVWGICWKPTRPWIMYGCGKTKERAGPANSPTSRFRSRLSNRHTIFCGVTRLISAW